jgi:hypothetical protein
VIECTIKSLCYVKYVKSFHYVKCPMMECTIKLYKFINFVYVG